MANGRTRNQHYVPQFLLKGFSLESSASPKVHIFDISKDVVRFNQSVSEVFSQNYFYDKENEIENFLSINVEAPASCIINEFRGGNFERLNNNNSVLIKFLCCQYERTVEARDDALRFINAHFKQIVADIARLNEWSGADLEGVKIMPSDKDSMRSFVSTRALSGVIDSIGMEDLRFHVLVNETERDLVISDHPVSRYNWLYRNLKDGRVGSMLAKGVQMYLPLSPKICLCAYDSQVYKFGPRSSDVSFVTVGKDIDWLNQLQVRSSHSFLAFSLAKMEVYVRGLKDSYHGKRIYTRESLHLGEEQTVGGEIKTSHLVYTDQVRLNARPDFFKVLKKARAHEGAFQERFPEISEKLRVLKKEITKDKISRA
ncbi:TPA: DUF4238 domain-containing protein [Pseudomonas aeruginosa]|nr:DUF4238 domain-containing protein [Pseudomonas aeruginosa]HBN9510203.1 DUF4238 domain-containing protein [Pseudomonas aeruginosa]HBN9780489.1 DUF4238 domain-containing protein [Pseudomonas aeruginosa]HBN9849691.1 DUF4238 domain-containing protein [Pseudomonas aeruginosa]HBN9863338.1 DUF4238 domain-containing protein [Pseudomonas aeruginosa]